MQRDPEPEQDTVVPLVVTEHFVQPLSPGFGLAHLGPSTEPSENHSMTQIWQVPVVVPLPPVLPPVEVQNGSSGPRQGLQSPEHWL